MAIRVQNVWVPASARWEWEYEHLPAQGRECGNGQVRGSESGKYSCGRARASMGVWSAGVQVGVGGARKRGLRSDVGGGSERERRVCAGVLRALAGLAVMRVWGAG